MAPLQPTPPPPVPPPPPLSLRLLLTLYRCVYLFSLLLLLLWVVAHSVHPGRPLMYTGVCLCPSGTFLYIRVCHSTSFSADYLPLVHPAHCPGTTPRQRMTTTPVRCFSATRRPPTPWLSTPSGLSPRRAAARWRWWGSGTATRGTADLPQRYARGSSWCGAWPCRSGETRRTSSPSGPTAAVAIAEVGIVALVKAAAAGVAGAPGRRGR